MQPLVPQTDDQVTFVAEYEPAAVGTPFISYIGADSLVYTYNATHDGNIATNIQSIQVTPIPLAGAQPGVKAKKIQRGYVSTYARTGVYPGQYMAAIDYILATDGNIYRFAENLPPAVKVDLGNYKFQDFIVRDPWEFIQSVVNLDPNIPYKDQILCSLNLVPVSGNGFIVAQRGTLTMTGTGATPTNQYDAIEFGQNYGFDFRVSKLWCSTMSNVGFTIVKRADNNHSYGIDTRFNSVTKAPMGGVTGKVDQTAINMAFGTNYQWKNNVRRAYGPFKLINCQN
ncbi:hypothetical protein [Arsenicibacter rosenii]|uniref:hypothetical protein n=1 Tax=Arsenicibacter rosenii TaxID=1750698 RepID=UPI001160903E|nr:hypothetical protein [Arsenicibacter rosenii]